MKTINLNETIKVKLTDLGKDIYYHRFDRLINMGIPNIERRFPDVDEDGFTNFQLWRFIEIYESYFSMTTPNIIKPLRLYIEEDKLEEADDSKEREILEEYDDREESIGKSKENLLVVKLNACMDDEHYGTLYETLQKQKENGLIILPAHCQPLVVPGDVRIEMEKGKVVM